MNFGFPCTWQGKQPSRAWSGSAFRGWRVVSFGNRFPLPNTTENRKTNLQNQLGHRGLKDCRRLDLLIYGATPTGIAATLISPLMWTGQSKPCSADVNREALRVAERLTRATYLELRPPARSASSYLGRWGADGTVVQSVWCVIWFESADFEPHPPSGAPPNPAGHAAGRGWVCLADGLVDLHGRRSTAGTRARATVRQPRSVVRPDQNPSCRHKRPQKKRC